MQPSFIVEAFAIFVACFIVEAFAIFVACFIVEAFALFVACSPEWPVITLSSLVLIA